MSGPVAVEYRDRIAIVRLQHGKVNAFDVELALAVTAAVAGAEADGKADAIVLTGQGSAFSAGVDLVRYVREDATYADRLLDAFDALLERVFNCRLPTVAAQNGHSLAGGFVLACACDYRLMAIGNGRAGVPEVAVGVPFPWLALELVRLCVAPHHLPELVALGATFPAHDARDRGFVQELVTPGTLLDRAVTIAERLAKNAGPAFTLQRAQLRAQTLRDPARAAHDVLVRAVWREAATRERVQAYLDRLAAR